MSKIFPSPLYSPEFEHDACGVGFIANIHGKRSHGVLTQAITGLNNLAHRGAIDADAVTGDGAGVLTQIPHAIFREFLESQGKVLYGDSDLGVAVVFVPLDDHYAQSHAKRIVEDAVKGEGMSFVAWRECPVDPDCLGQKADKTRPAILHGLFTRCPDWDDDQFERACFLAMKAAERRALAEKVSDFYVVSFSSRTITYKGLLNADQVRRFYRDFKNPRYETAFAMFHQRFATNTMPDWTKAQPFRMMAHNGEINTVRGNRNLMRAREYSPHHGVWGDRYKDLRPIIQENLSDSASFDNAIQLLTVGGRSCIHGISMMMPHAWEKDALISESVRDFYRYHSAVMEPWDGPAAIVFTDGRFIGAALDRNGLRPLRYKVYDDGTVVFGSEAGMIPDWGARVVKNARLGPGRLVAIDVVDGRVLDHAEVKDYLAKGEDYGTFVRRSFHSLHELAAQDTAVDPVGSLASAEQLAAFGYDGDEQEIILKPMACDGQEPVGSMGDDTPLAVLSRRPRLLYGYFKQLFAQVTNPAIDPLREDLVMSLRMILGGRLGLFDGMPDDAWFLEIDSPLIFSTEFSRLGKLKDKLGKVRTLKGVFPVAKGPDGMKVVVEALTRQAREFVERDHSRVLILSDRGVDRDHAPIPMLLLVGAVHQALVKGGLRMKCDIVVETGEARDVHQIACLLGFGANAVYPWLASDLLGHFAATGQLGDLSPLDALNNYRKAVDKGLLKIMSKMGISTLFSYQAAQIFEVVGVGADVVKDCFTGTPSPIGGCGYRQIAEDALRRHQRAYPAEGAVESWEEGFYKVNKRGDGEFHGWNPKVVSGMNKFLRGGGGSDAFDGYREAANEHPPTTIKDLLKIRYTQREAVELASVEPIEDIRRRFTTAGMSLGALSPEAHECLAIAMNSIGGKSNSGEGGEDPRRFYPYDNGDYANSAIKQVASGRFGVTAEYLANAKEIEIKIAQGAKPGEGGQLPGHKVSPLIARLRYSVPGVTLISPPPHHDIYSIEDLAQLIFDLKEVNPRAKVCVKLVSSSGVGTIAAGVAKAYADVILISGHEGGTGASPLSSIKNAGSAWEIGLAEAHQTLMMNGLRSRVTLRTDGGMKTGRDIVIAALLGAEEFNFGTAALIAAGCAMFRVCHLNTCPVGVATQREDLRAKFRGKPANVINYFNAVAEDVRFILSRLGFKEMDQLIGRTDLLEQVDDPGNPKTRLINLGGLLHNPDPSGDLPRIHIRGRNDSPGHELSLDHEILQDAKDTIFTRRLPRFCNTYRVRNINRNLGTRISGEIGFHHGNYALNPGAVDLTFRGSAGQSFGTFLVQGIRMTLLGEANDYVGKGMAAGEIIIRPDAKETFAWHENIIAGNTCLYGATGGFLFVAGRCGERFAVRNSGATAVVDGVGDHACEYMTAGTVVVLGRTGRNFGAGMSGGLAFVYDSDGKFEQRFNPDMVTVAPLTQSREADDLRRLIEVHHLRTASPHSKSIIDNWQDSISRFRRVSPIPATDDGPAFEYSFVHPDEPVRVAEVEVCPA